MDKNLLSLLKKYLTGSVTSQDRDEINEWYDQLDKAEARFNNPFVKRRVKQNLWAQIQLSTGKPEVRLPALRYWPVAAVILVLITAGLIFIQRSGFNRDRQLAYQTVTVPTGSTRNLLLPDGSHIILNSGAVFSYPAKFSDTSRLVKLVRGEAFFKIAKDPGRPFRISSEKLTTSVVGTSFNIRTLKRSGIYQIEVMTGKVKVSSGKTLLATLTRNFGLSAKLYTGEKIALTTHQETLPSWMSGTVTLQSASFNELADVLDQYYGIHLKSASNAVLQGSYTITFNRKDKLDSVLGIISSVNRMNYVHDGLQVIIK